MSQSNNNLSVETTIAPLKESNLDSEEKKTVDDSLAAQDKHNSINWHQVAHKLREHNRKLLKKVFQLEQEIIESHQSLEEQQKLVRSNNFYAAKQTEQINQYQEEIAELLQKIEIYQQETHLQQNVVETLNQQLESFQEKTIKLEQNCLELQAANNSKTYELLDKKREIQELNHRLQHQQQLFLQQKTNNHNREKASSEPIKAWSAKLTEKKPASSPSLIPDTNVAEKEDWKPAAIANNRHPVNSIAAVQLPRFSRHAEGE